MIVYFLLYECIDSMELPDSDRFAEVELIGLIA